MLVGDQPAPLTRVVPFVPEFDPWSGSLGTGGHSNATRKSLVLRALAASLALLIAWPGVAAATHTAPCLAANYSQNFFAGHTKAVSVLTGTRGTLEAQAWSLCTAPLNQDSGSFTWIAVEVAGTQRSIVQIGLAKCAFTNYAVCTGGMRLFWAWGRDSSQPGCSGFLNKDPAPSDLGAWSGVTSDYIVAKSGGYWKVYQSGVVQDQISTGSICWTPKHAVWTGEAWNKGDQIGGVAGNKYAFSASRYQTTGGGSWLNPNFPANCSDSLNPFFCEMAASDRLNLWTAH